MNSRFPARAHLLTVPWLIVAPLTGLLAGCGQSYSPNTYASNAAQQANKVEQGIIVGVRPVVVTAQGTAGALTGGAAGGIAGSQLGAGGPTSAFGALGGTVLGGLAGVAVERAGGDTKAFEYIVRKANKELVSVTQQNESPLAVGQKVLVIAGTQARIVPDYTVPEEPPSIAKPQSESGAGTVPGPVPGPGPVPAQEERSAEPRKGESGP